MVERKLEKTGMECVENNNPYNKTCRKGIIDQCNRYDMLMGTPDITLSALRRYVKSKIDSYVQNDWFQKGRI